MTSSWFFLSTLTAVVLRYSYRSLMKFNGNHFLCNTPFQTPVTFISFPVLFYISFSDTLYRGTGELKCVLVFNMAAFGFTHIPSVYVLAIGGNVRSCVKIHERALKPGFDTSTFHMGIKMDSFSLIQASDPAVPFPLSVTFHHCSIVFITDGRCVLLNFWRRKLFFFKFWHTLYIKCE